MRDAIPNTLTETPPSYWVFLNLGLVAMYLLLAAPTPGSLRSRRADSSIFVEGDDQS